ncbi:MAG: flagellar motor switch protein FliM [Acidobacteria bacterium]|jgi:flagellar motor switch protein FliM|nr:flagellar motor switch protein FliM [Acidobacteriota bacterium]
MDKILSQDEISALFSAMAADDLGLGQMQEASVPRRVANYDFHRADRISQDQIRSLHLLYDYFGRNFASSLSAYLRAFVDVNLISIDQVPYSDFLKLLPDPTLFSSLGMRPLESNVALELNPSVVFPMIDMLLGGPGNTPLGERSLTEIELNIIEGVVKLAMRDLKEAWRPIMDIEFYLDGMGSKPQMFQIVAPGETVVAVGLEIKVGENSGMMNICVPSRMLKTNRHRFAQQWNIRRQKVLGSEAEKILGLLQPASIPMTGELRDSSLTVEDLLKISIGDVIQLTGRVGDPALLCIAGVAKFQGRMIARRGKKAFEISREYNV